MSKTLWIQINWISPHLLQGLLTIITGGHGLKNPTALKTLLSVSRHYHVPFPVSPQLLGACGKCSEIFNSSCLTKKTCQDRLHRPRSDCFWKSSLIRVFPVSAILSSILNISPVNQGKVFKILEHLPYIQKMVLGFYNVQMYIIYRVATVREKVLENEKFSRSGKSQGVIFSVREIKKKMKKVMEKSGNFKIFLKRC